MASDKGLPSWFSVHEECLSKISTADAFLDAVNIWIERPQVLNRRLLGSYLLQTFLTSNYGNFLAKIFAMRQSEPILRERLVGLVKIHEERVEEDDESVAEVKIRSLLPRESSKYCNVLEIIIQDNSNKSVTFIPFEEDQVSNELRCNVEQAYRVSLVEKENIQSLNLSVADKRTKGNGITCPTVEWLKSSLLPKLHKWTVEDGKMFSLGQSLRLVSVEKYSVKYEELKKKYKHFVKMWPERTDPHKFVYEDVAIATYLLLLWKESDGENVKTQTFVDLGCGNGLLVHILNNEGHSGRGIDLRARKVWEFYDSKTILEVSSLDPSCQTYPDVDWLIGNHSDELTPWIPVIAARSSHKCKYFVLPCCFHDFYCKFQRMSSNERQYRSYLDHVENIGTTCGFDVEEDVLRIPSTKRVCQIGKKRRYGQEGQKSTEEEISSMLDNARYGKQNEIRNLNDHPTENQGQNQTVSPSHHHDNPRTDESKASLCESTKSEKAHVLKQFVPRSNTEPVKNCTKLDKQLLDEIVRKVATELLSRTTLDETTVDCKAESDQVVNKEWNKGGTTKACEGKLVRKCPGKAQKAIIPGILNTQEIRRFMELSEVSKLFDQNVLRQLRCEAGGIKTVLRNSHQVFKVQGGRVEIRDWREDSHGKKKDDKKPSGTQKYWKTKLCWFHSHHPDGCPMESDQCSFAHGMEELIPPQR